MQPSFQQNSQQIISMEEYLWKRQAIREAEQKRQTMRSNRAKENNPVHIMTELFI